MSNKAHLTQSDAVVYFFCKFLHTLGWTFPPLPLYKHITYNEHTNNNNTYINSNHTNQPLENERVLYRRQDG